MAARASAARTSLVVVPQQHDSTTARHIKATSTRRAGPKEAPHHPPYRFSRAHMGGSAASSAAARPVLRASPLLTSCSSCRARACRCSCGSHSCSTDGTAACAQACGSSSSRGVRTARPRRQGRACRHRHSDAHTGPPSPPAVHAPGVSRRHPPAAAPAHQAAAACWHGWHHCCRGCCCCWCPRRPVDHQAAAACPRQTAAAPAAPIGGPQRWWPS